MSAYYLFDNVNVTDPDGLRRYAAGAAKTVAAHGGRYLTAPTTPIAVEGQTTLTAAVLIEFPNLDAARSWYDSPEYQPLKALRHRSATNTAVLLDGLPT